MAKDRDSWKDALAPFAEHCWDMWHTIDGATIPYLTDLLAACDKVTATNCWFSTHDAARIIRPWVKSELDQQIRTRGPWAWAGIPPLRDTEGKDGGR